MRMAYRQQLDFFAHDLIVLCDVTKTIMSQASEALITNNLEASEKALSNAEHLEEIRQRCEKQAVELLVLESPVARDLRQVVSSIYIVEDFARMGALGIHIASSVRRRFPESAVPKKIIGFFAELARLVSEMSDTIRRVLIEPNADVALSLATADDAVDDINHHLMRQITDKPWPYSTRSAVDTAMLLRFYERYADHTVNVSGRIVYLTTGLQPGEYTKKRRADEAEAEAERRWQELEKRFGEGGR